MSLLPVYSPWPAWYCSACPAGTSPTLADPTAPEWALTFSALSRRFHSGQLRAVPCFH